MFLNFKKKKIIKKRVGFDIIPSKLVKVSTDFLSKPLTIVINDSLRDRVLPDESKIASIVPIDKGKPNKNEISNFCFVRIYMHIN